MSVFQALDHQATFLSVGVEGRPVLAYWAVLPDQEWAEQVPFRITVDDVKAALFEVIAWALRCLVGDYGMVSHQLPITDRCGGAERIPACGVPPGYPTLGPPGHVGVGAHSAPAAAARTDIPP